MVGGKFKIKQWKITKAKGTKFSDTNIGIKSGWGAFCNGVSTGRKWSEKEENLHTNVLELPTQLTNCNVLNAHADWESQNAKDNSEWKLDVSVFQEIATHMRQPSLGLFASRLCHQLPRYIAWKPDPGSIATGACLHPWDREYGFDFPPFNLRKQVLKKFLEVKMDHSDTHLANSALVSATSKNVCTATISSTSDKKFINKSTEEKSAVWINSGKVCKWKELQLQGICKSHIQEKAQQLITNRPGVS